jgi:hypothetical protein
VLVFRIVRTCYDEFWIVQFMMVNITNNWEIDSKRKRKARGEVARTLQSTGTRVHYFYLMNTRPTEKGRESGWRDDDKISRLSTFSRLDSFDEEWMEAVLEMLMFWEHHVEYWMCSQRNDVLNIILLWYKWTSFNQSECGRVGARAKHEIITSTLGKRIVLCHNNNNNNILAGSNVRSS